MSKFDTADKAASAALDQVFADPIVWRPMSHRAGGRYTQGEDIKSRQPDPDRPVRGLDQSADPFMGMVVWRPAGVDPGTSHNEQSNLPVCDCMLDIDRRYFMTPDGEMLPERGDLFDLVTETGELITVENPREVVDDGTSRVQMWCNAPE